MSPKDERFSAKTTVLIECVTHHIEEEETGWFPKGREALSRKDLQASASASWSCGPRPRTTRCSPALKKALDAVIK